MSNGLTLVPPCTDLEKSYMEALHELPEKAANASISWLSLTRRDVENDFPGYVEKLKRLGTRGEDSLVPSITYWGVVDGQYIGRISLRLSLNKRLSELGGHAGYDVRPSQRGKGYASEMLRRIIVEARGYGLLRLLLTCDETNIPSKRVIEKCGGEAIKPLPGGEGMPRKLRSWIPTVPLSPRVESALERTMDYLHHSDARAHLERDPYWPKWDSPWWHMLTLSEIGLGHRIPGSLLEFMGERLHHHYLHHFPLIESELPPGTDPVRHILCHCAMGCMMRLLRENDIDVVQMIPWLPQWLERYQMEDGGFNCDEEAYTRSRPVSSMVSTLPMMVLHQLEDIPLETPLARGYDYVVSHRFARSIRTGEILDQRWLSPLFPRFFKYDVLRGLAFAAGFAHLNGCSFDIPGISETTETVNRWFNGGPGGVTRVHMDDGTFLPGSEGTWPRGPSTSFPLLTELSRPEEALTYLSLQWSRVKWLMSSMAQAGKNKEDLLQEGRFGGCSEKISE